MKAKCSIASPFSLLRGYQDTQNLVFMYNLRVIFDRHSTVWHIMGLLMLSELHPIIHMYPRKGRDRFRSNICHSSRHGIPFHVITWYPKYGFCMQFESHPQLKWHSLNNKGILYTVKSSSHCIFTSNEGYGPLHRQCIHLRTVYYLISCAMRVSIPKPDIIVQFESWSV